MTTLGKIAVGELWREFADLILDNPEMEGFLYRKSGKLFTANRWMRLYVVLKGRVLYYFDRKPEGSTARTPRKVTILNSKSTIEILSPTLGRDHCFELTSRKEVHILSAFSHEELTTWIAAIRNAIWSNMPLFPSACSTSTSSPVSKPAVSLLTQAKQVASVNGKDKSKRNSREGLVTTLRLINRVTSLPTVHNSGALHESTTPPTGLGSHSLDADDSRRLEREKRFQLADMRFSSLLLHLESKYPQLKQKTGKTMLSASRTATSADHKKVFQVSATLSGLPSVPSNAATCTTPTSDTEQAAHTLDTAGSTVDTADGASEDELVDLKDVNLDMDERAGRGKGHMATTDAEEADEPPMPHDGDEHRPVVGEHTELAAVLRRVPGMDKYLGVLADNEIDVYGLKLLEKEDLVELGLPLGPRKKLLHLIRMLREEDCLKAPARNSIAIAAPSPSIAVPAKRRAVTTPPALLSSVETPPQSPVADPLAPPQPPLLTLPIDLLAEILRVCEPHVIGRAAQVCRHLHAASLLAWRHKYVDRYGYDGVPIGRSRRATLASAGEAPVSPGYDSLFWRRLYQRRRMTSARWKRGLSTLSRRVAAHGDMVTSLAVVAGGACVVTGSIDKTLKLFDLRPSPQATTASLVATIEAGLGVVNTAQTVGSSDSGLAGIRWLFAGGNDRHLVRLWKIESTVGDTLMAGFELLKNISDSTAGEVTHLHTDGLALMTSSDDKLVRRFDVETGHVVSKLTGHTRAVWTVQFDDAVGLAASGSADRSVRVWDVRTPHGGCVGAAESAHDDSVQCLAFDEAFRLVSGGSDCKIKLFDLRMLGRGAMATAEGHDDAVWSVAFDGQRLVSGGSYDDSTVRVWRVPHDPAAMHCHAVLREPAKAVSVACVAFADDCLLYGTSNGELVVHWFGEVDV